MTTAESDTDPRVQRTRAALRAAFNSLILERGFDAFSAADVAERAGVGRSTFYEHFAGKEALLAAVLARILEPMAEACRRGGIDRPDTDPALEAMAAHFWDMRRMAAALMAGRARQVMVRLLADLIEEKLPARSGDGLPKGLLAARIAHGQIGLLEEWITGRHGGSPAQIAAGLRAAAVHF